MTPQFLHSYTRIRNFDFSCAYRDGLLICGNTRPSHRLLSYERHQESHPFTRRCAPLALWLLQVFSTVSNADAAEKISASFRFAAPDGFCGLAVHELGYCLGGRFSRRITTVAGGASSRLVFMRASKSRSCEDPSLLNNAWIL
jgi:hypothetical protein